MYFVILIVICTLRSERKRCTYDVSSSSLFSQVWVCEFCGTSNEIDIVPEEMPIKEDTSYMLVPAPAVEGAVGGAAVEDSIVVFCIDISGSMCVTTEVSVHGLSVCMYKPLQDF